MKLGEIKIEALKLMFVNYNKDYSISDLSNLMSDENCGSYLANMPGSINRCFSVIEEKRVLPVRTYTIKEFDTSGYFARFSLSSIPDFFDIERVIKESRRGYIGCLPYIREGNDLLISDYDEEAIYRVVYKPSIERVMSFTDEYADIDIPDKIAAFIPYFIKGDLYREDEPSEASEARNWFEQAMDSISEPIVNSVDSVSTVYSQTEF